jgi:hypothetical protein
MKPQLMTSGAGSMSRVQSLLQVRAYIEEQAKSVLPSLAQSIDATDRKNVGHSERLVEYAV